MNENRHRARKRFGQNFLHDTAVIRQIVDLLQIEKDDDIIEIGPGRGALTAFLVKQARRLDVIEIDRVLADTLAERIGQTDRLTIHRCDALSFDFAAIMNNKTRIVGNLPYNISTPLLFHLLHYLPAIQDMTFMLQKEVVERLSANKQTKQYGRLSIMFQYYCRVEPLFTVGPAAFKPRPTVDSAMVKLTPRNAAGFKLENEDSFASVVRTAFAQRRKTLRNSLKNVLSEAALHELGLSPQARAENLSVKQYVELANACHRLKIRDL